MQSIWPGSASSHPREGESNRSRWDTDPSWQVVQSAHFAAVPARARRIVRRKQRAQNVEQLTRGSYGYLVSLVAQQVADGEHWDISRGIRELADHLTAEAGKPGKDFGELVRSRRKERELPVKQREHVLPMLPPDWHAGGEHQELLPVLNAEPDALSPSWEEESPASRLQLRYLAAERRVQETFHRLEEAELRQEPAGKMVWYEAQYEQELAAYARVCRQRAAAGDGRVVDAD